MISSLEKNNSLEWDLREETNKLKKGEKITCFQEIIIYIATRKTKGKAFIRPE